MYQTNTNDNARPVRNEGLYQKCFRVYQFWNSFYVIYIIDIIFHVVKIFL